MRGAELEPSAARTSEQRMHECPGQYRDGQHDQGAVVKVKEREKAVPFTVPVSVTA